MAEAIFEVFRGNREGGKPVTYRVPVAPGMVVLDALHHIQAHQAPDLAVRWNCKAGKCGSCSAEVNGRPAHLQDPHGCPSPGQAHHGLSAESVPHNQRPGHGVSWNYRVNRKIPPFEPRPAPNGRCTHGTWTGCRSFASVLNVSSARMCATFSVSTRRWKSSGGRGISSGWRLWKCIL